MSSSGKEDEKCSLVSFPIQAIDVKRGNILNRTDILPRVGKRSEFLKFLMKEKASCPTYPSNFLRILQYRTFSIRKF